MRNILSLSRCLHSHPYPLSLAHGCAETPSSLMFIKESASSISSLSSPLPLQKGAQGAPSLPHHIPEGPFPSPLISSLDFAIFSCRLNGLRLCHLHLQNHLFAFYLVPLSSSADPRQNRRATASPTLTSPPGVRVRLDARKVSPRFPTFPSFYCCPRWPPLCRRSPASVGSRVSPPTGCHVTSTRVPPQNQSLC